METTNYIPRIIENYAFDENLTGRHMVFKEAFGCLVYTIHFLVSLVYLER